MHYFSRTMGTFFPVYSVLLRPYTQSPLMWKGLRCCLYCLTVPHKSIKCKQRREQTHIRKISDLVRFELQILVNDKSLYFKSSFHLALLLD